MAPQLQLNQGPQDALLYDNSRSYFTNVGYTRTSNFQVELIDVDPQNTAQLGSTMQYVIPKSADLLGPCDLCIEFDDADPGDGMTAGTGSGLGKTNLCGWVDSLGFAMIDKIVFSIGSQEIETITGDQLQITNELMKGDETRLGRQILKTGAPLTYGFVDVNQSSGTTTNHRFGCVIDDNLKSETSRLIVAETYDGTQAARRTVIYKGKKLIVPLGLFFTKHPSAYFPLAAISGSNDVRISVKLRPLSELVQMISEPVITASTGIGNDSTPEKMTLPKINIKNGQCKLRCHYVHVTGPEASLLMNKEHVRLLKLWPSPQSVTKVIKNTAGKQTLFSFELPFLHPVSELVIVIRKVSEMNSSTDSAVKVDNYDQGVRTKNWFAFHGSGVDPNPDSDLKRYLQTMHAADTTGVESMPTIVTGDCKEAYLSVDSFKLTLNGQERHSALDGIDRKYLMDRLMPMLHSNTTTAHTDASTLGTLDYDMLPDNASSAQATNILDGARRNVSGNWLQEKKLEAIAQMVDRKEIYVYPFCLNPEGANPSGAVNFSKVSHAKLTIMGEAFASDTGTDVEYRCDVWGVHYNWLQIKDGRALTSFA